MYIWYMNKVNNPFVKHMIQIVNTYDKKKEKNKIYIDILLIYYE